MSMQDSAMAMQRLLEELDKKALVLSRKRISRPNMAKLFGLKICTVRDAIDIPCLKGVRDRPTRYLISDVIEYLRSLNPGKEEVWSEKFLSTSDVAEFLTARDNRNYSIQALVKCRERGLGPGWIYVTARTIRYRIEDLELWRDNVVITDVVCNRLHS